MAIPQQASFVRDTSVDVAKRDIAATIMAAAIGRECLDQAELVIAVKGQTHFASKSFRALATRSTRRHGVEPPSRFAWESFLESTEQVVIAAIFDPFDMM